MKRTIRKSHAHRDTMSAHKQHVHYNGYPDRRNNLRLLTRKDSLRQHKANRCCYRRSA